MERNVGEVLEPEDRVRATRFIKILLAQAIRLYWEIAAPLGDPYDWVWQWVSDVLALSAECDTTIQEFLMNEPRRDCLTRKLYT